MKRESQRVITAEHLEQELAMAISQMERDGIFILTDETTRDKCLPKIQTFRVLKNAVVITIPPTDEAKNTESLCSVWKKLSDNGANRHSLMINLGGGMVTDLGGFAASTFKRGINFINIPTTLLAMVDASVGGKTGINFNGLKNEIGVFNDSRFVILDTDFLNTLDSENIRSGYAEMIKHGLISDEKTWAQLMNFDLAKPDFQVLKSMVAESVKVKERIVEEDPLEKGIRKALNLGHTIGHALESFALERYESGATKGKGYKPLMHGYAVAYGIMGELYLSAKKTGFPTDKMHQTVEFIKENYGRFDFSCDDYNTLFELMKHDKKNSNGMINFTLLGGIGDIIINQTATKEEIFEALDFIREG